MNTIARTAATIALIVAAALFPTTSQAQQSVGVTVIVNGQTMTFDQPPVEQAGRVFVPLRGIFEQLGASVVYQNGTINATGRGRNVSLQIGSTNATVNGQPQTLDSPPFVDGSRTLVPLRFVAQALGASVNWNNNTSTVTINGGGGGNDHPGYNGGPPPPPMNPDMYLADRSPSDGAMWMQGSIRARFVRPVRLDSVRIMLDGNDVTAAASVSRTGFVLPVRDRLSPGRHRVRISATSIDGTPFTTGWDFRS